MRKKAELFTPEKLIDLLEEKGKDLDYKVNVDIDYDIENTATISFYGNEKDILLSVVVLYGRIYTEINIFDKKNNNILHESVKTDKFDIKEYQNVINTVEKKLKKNVKYILNTPEKIYDYGEENNWQGLTNKQYEILSQDVSLARMAVADMQDKGIVVPETLKKFRRYSMSFKDLIVRKIAKEQKMKHQINRVAKVNKKAEYYNAVATFINPDGNYFEKRRFIGEYTEEEIIEKVQKEFPNVKAEDITVEFGVQSSKKQNVTKKTAGDDLDVKLKVQKNKPAGLDTSSPKSLPESIRPMMQDLKGKLSDVKEIETQLAARKAELDAKYQQAKDESKIVEKQSEIENLTTNIGKLLFAAKNETFQFQDNLVALTHQVKTVPAKATDKWKFEKVFAKLEELMGKDNAQKFLDNTLNGLQSQATEKTITELNIFSPTQKQMKKSDTSDTNKFIDALKEIYVNLRNYYLDIKKANNIIETELATGTTASKKQVVTKKAGESGGWVVNPDEAFDKLDLFVQAFGAETALDALARSMGTDELSENLAYIFRMYDFQEGDSNYVEEEEDTDIESKKKVNLKKAKTNKKAKINKKATVSLEMEIDDYIELLKNEYETSPEDWKTRGSRMLMNEFYEYMENFDGGKVKQPSEVMDNFLINGSFCERATDFTADGEWSNKFEKYNGNWEEFCENEAVIYNEDAACTNLGF